MTVELVPAGDDKAPVSDVLVALTVPEHDAVLSMVAALRVIADLERRGGRHEGDGRHTPSKRNGLGYDMAIRLAIAAAAQLDGVEGTIVDAPVVRTGSPSLELVQPDSVEPGNQI